MDNANESGRKDEEHSADDNSGIYYGDDVVNSKMHIYDRLTNRQQTIVWGQSGGGKSFDVKMSTMEGFSFSEEDSSPVDSNWPFKGDEPTGEGEVL